MTKQLVQSLAFNNSPDKKDLFNIIATCLCLVVLPFLSSQQSTGYRENWLVILELKKNGGESKSYTYE